MSIVIDGYLGRSIDCVGLALGVHGNLDISVGSEGVSNEASLAPRDVGQS